MRVLLAGSSGFIGTELRRQLAADDHEVRRLVRRAPTTSGEARWAPELREVDLADLEWADAVVNLSGASTGHFPWTPSYKRTILRSRIDATLTLVEAMARTATRPAVLLNASAVGFYGDRPGEPLPEDATKGTGFLSDVVLAWEQASRLAPDGVRVVNLRTGLVVGRGGAFDVLIPLTALGAGARYGSGDQSWPWISLYDEAAAIRHLLTSELSGPVNLAGPTPATADRVTRLLARELHRWYLLHVPAWSIRLLGEFGESLLLADQEQVPAALLDDGFVFRHETVGEALRAI